MYAPRPDVIMSVGNGRPEDMTPSVKVAVLSSQDISSQSAIEL
jgi:hypothetical protein